MITSIVKHTNKKITNTLSELPQNEKPTFNSTTDNIEITALLGLMFFRGLLGVNDHYVNNPFSDEAGHYVFGGVMGRNRFKFLQSRLHFDDESTREDRWKEDSFAAIPQE